MWLKAIMGVLGIGGEYLGAKAKLKQTKIEGEIYVTQQRAKDISSWEQTHAKASASSWKDEFWTIVWAVPVILAFTPDGVQYALAGFDALQEMPEWYTYTLMTIVLASFGIRLSGTVKGQLDKWTKK